ncbi:hypothetical protein N7478_011694 [Penicillium angulare]|uniref:uncharacterized protein n=1 Tax=Penicillium angulare TaxID=116970 RepID=UPI00253F898B|nr:uncharacterized protein N7478_011694 [Penicillium angulare]KAJ5261099.1 hypothetical protein N7478_011694 [Penicillium angulare]
MSHVATGHLNFTALIGNRHGDHVLVVPGISGTRSSVGIIKRQTDHYPQSIRQHVFEWLSVFDVD